MARIVRYVMRNAFNKVLKVFVFIATPFCVVDVVSAAPPLEYCENRTSDQQLGAGQRNSPMSVKENCFPLVEKREASSSDSQAVREQLREIKVENIQDEATTFLRKYNRFLECCKTDLTELEAIEELGDEVGALLAAAQDGLFSEHMKIRGWTLSKLIPPVAKARIELKALRAKLEHIVKTQKQLGELNYQDASREAVRLRDLEESIERDFKPRSLPAGPKTGTSIGASPAVGSAIGTTPKRGPQIGSEGAVGTDLGVTPKTGRDIGATSTTGFEIGATGKAGADIGDSRLNSDPSTIGSSLQQSTVGSSISDTTVGSSLERSNIGSSMGDASTDSSLQRSTVGSSLQNRSSSP